MGNALGILGQPALEEVLPSMVGAGDTSICSHYIKCSARGLGSWVERWWVCRQGPLRSLPEGRGGGSGRGSENAPFFPSFVDGSGAATSSDIEAPHTSLGTAQAFCLVVPPRPTHAGAAREKMQPAR